MEMRARFVADGPGSEPSKKRFGDIFSKPSTTSIRSPFPTDPPQSIRLGSFEFDSHQELPLSNSMKKIAFSSAHPFPDEKETFPRRVHSQQSQGPKRNRSPPSASSRASLSMSPTTEVDSEREMKAKVKRLARFHAELSQPEDETPELSWKVSESKTSLIKSQTMTFPAGTTKKSDPMSVRLFPDGEDTESFASIRGACPDMCPETERGERERKGDLDRYERLDGERNQTSISLAVKKYTRTAERDAKLIRPLPVLQRTVDYLLNLLNHPYDDRLLGLYNFLWDRMRAVRLDLRMQHIFNRDAIEMLEKMIRLHIIAMHELSEYSKGEGFSEGFDAHLNIEQMNKTSVELFQMYNDHRRRGSVIPTEKEFRGYYALLKLDKHPGYRVEPSELSLNLASMSPDVRHAPEIIFAREVARACRTGNFIAFFRLARKATYLQACLMHAHFSKLRTLALASLHSGLQNNQGIPVDHVVRWLAIEGEDIDGILEYYGFSIKKFEEPYMVKVGPFLNIDEDYRTKCSLLVKLKRSKSILDNVVCGQDLVAPEKLSPIILSGPSMQEMEVHAGQASINVTDDDMSELVSSDHSLGEETEPEMLPAELLQTGSSMSVLEIEMDDDESQMVRDHDAPLVEPFQLYIPPISNDAGILRPSKDSTFDDLSPQSIGMQAQIVEREKTEEILKTEHMAKSIKYEEDIARLKRLLRRWKQHSSRKRETREQRHSLACAALDSLTLGPPLRLAEIERSTTDSSLNIDDIVRERYYHYEGSWASLNVSDVVSSTLSARNPSAVCLVWKLAVCLPKNYGREDRNDHMLSSWLLRKLMGSSHGEENNGHLLSSPSLSIWKTTQIQQTPNYCCYSVIREMGFLVSEKCKEMSGLSAVMFYASESIPWATQRDRLDAILDSIPPGASLPLVVLVKGSDLDHHSVVIRGLGLEHLRSKTVISHYRVFLINEKHLQRNEHLMSYLHWLAENSPLQPCVHEIKSRDLVAGFLNASLGNLESSQSSPDDCVAVFNKALDNSAQEVVSAADSNKNGWPAPEIELLSNKEFQFIANLLPRFNWSSAARIQPLVTALRGCKLPSFSDEWQHLIGQGCEDLNDLMKQKAALEFCLFGYLQRSVGLQSGNLASLEARVMTQKMVFLERRSNRHFIIPDWITIFRRIYHWRLLGLSSATEKLVSAYVRTAKGIDLLDSSKTKSLSTIELPVCRVRLEEWKIETDDHVSSSTDLNDHQVLGADLSTSPPPPWDGHVDHDQRKVVGLFVEEKKARFDDRLVDLLEKCDRVQDSIGLKLAVYF